MTTEVSNWPEHNGTLLEVSAAGVVSSAAGVCSRLVLLAEH